MAEKTELQQLVEAAEQKLGVKPDKSLSAEGRLSAAERAACEYEYNARNAVEADGTEPEPAPVPEPTGPSAPTDEGGSEADAG